MTVQVTDLKLPGKIDGNDEKWGVMGCKAASVGDGHVSFHFIQNFEISPEIVLVLHKAFFFI